MCGSASFLRQQRGRKPEISFRARFACSRDPACFSGGDGSPYLMSLVVRITAIDSIANIVPVAASAAKHCRGLRNTADLAVAQWLCHFRNWSRYAAFRVCLRSIILTGSEHGSQLDLSTSNLVVTAAHAVRRRTCMLGTLRTSCARQRRTRI